MQYCLRSRRILGLCYVKMMMKFVKAGGAASKILSRQPALFRRLSTAPILRISAALNASACASKPCVASHRHRHCRPVLCMKLAGLLPQCRQTSNDASSSDGGLNHTGLHELHVSNGGKMVPFGGYSMPVQYSDLSVGESHKWTREKASLFDVGHM